MSRGTVFSTRLHVHPTKVQSLCLAFTKTCLFKYIENVTTKNWKFSGKNSDSFHISFQNIDCGYSLELPQQGSSNKYPQSMFLSRNKKNNVYCKVPFYYIKVGFKGFKFWWCLCRYIRIQGMLRQTAKTCIRLLGFAGWSECLLSTHAML